MSSEVVSFLVGMRPIRLTNQWFGYLLAFAVVGLVVSGIAVAAKKPAANQHTGCYSKKTGVLRVVKGGKRCKRAERKIVWMKDGTRGARGPRGAQGQSGTDGTAGPRGATGAAGVAGAQGANGPTGSTGGSGPAGATGPTGASGATGPTGADGTARAYAEVNDVSNDYVAARTAGFTGTVTKPSATTGIYCLTPDPTLGIDPATVAAVASPSFGNTSAHGGSAEVRGAPGGSCSTTEFAVHTYDSAGLESDSVSFHIIVP
jgi:hypothetical protein